MDMKTDTIARSDAGGWRDWPDRIASRARLAPGVQGAFSRLRSWASRSPWAVWAVVVPTLAAAAYCYLLWPSQYVSEAQFFVRGPQPQSSSLLGQMLGSGLREAPEETSGVVAFLTSHDAVQNLRHRLDLVAMLRRNPFDVANHLGSNPSDEQLLKIYRRHVNVGVDSGTGIVTLQVRAYRPSDAKQMADSLMQASEQEVNAYSERADADAVSTATIQVEQAEDRLSKTNEQLTRFRTDKRALDPAQSSSLTLAEGSALDAQVATEKSKLAQMQVVMKPGTPTLRQQEANVASLQQTLASQKGQLTGGDNSMAPTLGQYQKLALQQEVASKDYAAAISALQAARSDSQRQHLYLVPVVHPNRPERALYPNRPLTIATIFISLCVAYGIGWLIVAGVREHAA